MMTESALLSEKAKLTQFAVVNAAAVEGTARAPGEEV